MTWTYATPSPAQVATQSMPSYTRRKTRIDEIMGVRARQTARGRELPVEPERARERRPGGGLEGEEGKTAPALASLARPSHKPFLSYVYPTERSGSRVRTTAP